MSGLVRFFGRNAESGARTAVHLATSQELDGVTGLYFFHDRPARSRPVTYDPEVAARLWTISERLTHPGVSIPTPPQEAKP